MKKATPFLIATVLIGLCYFVVDNYRSDRKGQLLYADFFNPRAGINYGNSRALATPAAGGVADRDLAVLEEAYRAHQTGEYAVALAAANDLLATNSVADEQLFLLAGTAAMATGRYDATYFSRIDPAAPAAGWYRALLALRREELDLAREELLRIDDQAGLTDFPVRELLDEL